MYLICISTPLICSLSRDHPMKRRGKKNPIWMRHIWSPFKKFNTTYFHNIQIFFSSCFFLRVFFFVYFLRVFFLSPRFFFLPISVRFLSRKLSSSSTSRLPRCLYYLCAMRNGLYAFSLPYRDLAFADFSCHLHFSSFLVGRSVGGAKQNESRKSVDEIAIFHAKQ